MQQIYWYVTAVIAAKFGIALHAVQMLSTHLHEVLTDMRGELPAFLCERNRLIANAVKVHREWPEEVFQRAATSCVQLFGVDAVLRAIGYTLANVVDAGLVEHPDQWPGVTVSVNDIGERVIVVERPSVYFDPKNPNWPERVSIPITMPPSLIETFGADAKEVLRSSVASAIEAARDAARSAGRFVKTTAAKLCSVPVTHRSNGFRPFGARNPTFAAGGNRDMVEKARTERKRFHELYRRALDALKNGTANVPFPSGTWRWARELLPESLVAVAATGGEGPEKQGEVGVRAATSFASLKAIASALNRRLYERSTIAGDVGRLSRAALGVDGPQRYSLPSNIDTANRAVAPATAARSAGTTANSSRWHRSE
ncbi:hypothetical protein [Labilithrix luteola]|uniref:hypothetical protein n=1 Tax=Labilithrix luteola TaxID=1391654 RepID=UPI0011BA9AFB|nr:hypothetical protein [Labilithrix luteola]